MVHLFCLMFLASSALGSETNADDGTRLTTLESTKVTEPTESTKGTITTGSTGAIQTTKMPTIPSLPQFYRWSRVGARSIQLSWDEHKVRGLVPNTVYLLVTPNGAAEPRFEEQAEFSVGSITFDGLQPDTQYAVLLTASIGAHELMEHRTAIKTLRDGEADITGMTASVSTSTASPLTSHTIANTAIAAALVVCMVAVLA